MFTIAQALTRLTSGRANLFVTSNGTMSAGQQLQIFNEILDEWYTNDTWRGVRVPNVALASVGGIISLGAGYLRAEKRIVVTSDGQCGRYFEIKPLEYQYQPGGPGYFDVTKGCLGVAIDLGDNTSGARRYQLTGVAATLDAYTYSAVLRKRYVFATDTATVVVPDCYPALELSVMAKNARFEGAHDVAAKLWAEVYATLDSDLGQFEDGNDLGAMQVDALCAAPNYNAL